MQNVIKENEKCAPRTQRAARAPTANLFMNLMVITLAIYGSSSSAAARALDVRSIFGIISLNYVGQK